MRIVAAALAAALTSLCALAQQLPAPAGAWQGTLETGRTLLAEGHYAEAEKFLRRTLDETAPADAHSTAYALGLNLLAHAYRGEARYGEATELFQHCERILESDPEQAASVAVVLDSLGDVYLLQGKTAEADRTYARALQIQERSSAVGDIELAVTLNDLAVARFAEQRWDEAETYYRRALALREQDQGADSAEAAAILNNLGELYHKTGRLDEAQAAFERSLAIRDKTLRPDHPSFVVPLNNLATLYAQRGEYDRAVPLFERALAIAERELGPQHPDTAVALANMAEVNRLHEQYSEAESEFKKAIAATEAALGPTHPRLPWMLRHYALLLRRTNRKNAAKQLETRAAFIDAAHAPVVTAGATVSVQALRRAN